MGKGAFNHTNLHGLPEHAWEEIARHNKVGDRWIVIDEHIYDVSQWGKKHPGGEKIIAGWAGQDASEAWSAFHIDKSLVSKYMKPLLIGRVKAETEIGSTGNISGIPPVIQDFHKVRKAAESMNLFKPNAWFYLLHLAHIVALDVIGCWIMWRFGTGWIPFTVASTLLATAQIQAGWNQHDYGHLSVFSCSRWNHWAQIFIINIIKGASSDWWNYRHFNHHSKPNTLKADPDIRLDYLFLVGKVLPVELITGYDHFLKSYVIVICEVGEEEERPPAISTPASIFLPQIVMFIVALPPLLLPLYFNFEIPYYLIKRRRWGEIFWMSLFFVRWQVMFGSLLGFWGVFRLFLFVRFLESHWFVWATQMSHLPMEVNYDLGHDWVTAQLKATCNVEQSFFNDWWSGHLNFQIEHHLFPTMPRHNLHKVAPLCRSLCEKHGLNYQCKPLLKALQDITSLVLSHGKEPSFLY